MFHKLAHDIYTAALIKLAFKANQNNFTHGTSAVFSKTTKRPDREPDKKSPKKGSDSEYWVTPMGIVRGSDHWGIVGTCNWDLAGSPDHPGKKVYGFSPWENFSKKTAELGTSLDLSNWDNLSTKEQNAIIKTMKPHSFAQLPGDRLGFGWEGSAYRAISPDFGTVSKKKPYNAIIKKFYGFEGEESRLKARYDMIKNNPNAFNVGKSIRNPRLQKLIEAGELLKADKLYRKLQKGAWAQSTKKYDVMANPDNTEIFAKIIKDAYEPSYEMFSNGYKTRNKQLGAIVMEALDIPPAESLSEADFASINTDLAERIMKRHLGPDPAYGTDFRSPKDIPNGEKGPNMRYAPILKGLSGKTYKINDAYNVFDPKALPFTPQEVAFHNLGMSKNDGMKMYDLKADIIEEA